MEDSCVRSLGTDSCHSGNGPVFDSAHVSYSLPCDSIDVMDGFDFACIVNSDSGHHSADWHGQKTARRADSLLSLAMGSYP